MSTTTAAKAPKASTTPKKLNAADMNKGDIFSEMSHYTYQGKNGKNHQFIHHSNGTVVELGESYIEGFLHTANQHLAEIEVGREDKLWTDKQIAEAIAKGEYRDPKLAPRVGDVRVPGIRSIWENIHSAHVFQVCFMKQDTPLPAKKLNELREAQAEACANAIAAAKTGKKSLTAAAMEEIKKVQENPILPYEQGEARELTGYKVQFTSRDGRYSCVDMKKPKEDNIRPVNINTIQWLVMDGVKYIVK